MDAEPMTDERLEEIGQQFRNARLIHRRYGVGPGWPDLYAGEELLAEVRRLRAVQRILDDPHCRGVFRNWQRHLERRQPAAGSLAASSAIAKAEFWQGPESPPEPDATVEAAP